MLFEILNNELKQLSVPVLISRKSSKDGKISLQNGNVNLKQIQSFKKKLKKKKETSVHKELAMNDVVSFSHNLDCMVDHYICMMLLLTQIMELTVWVTLISETMNLCQ